MEKGGFLYIMTNLHHTTLYVGITSDLIVRVQQHQSKTFSKSFTARYNLVKLVYWESLGSMAEAVAKEKQLKGGSRKKKEDLISRLNPEWRDLSAEVLSW